MLSSMHNFKHYGYAKMITLAKEMNVIWPNISSDIMEFLGDCDCSLKKNNRKKILRLGNPQEIKHLDKEKSYALDLYTFGQKSYLSILQLSTGEY